MFEWEAARAESRISRATSRYAPALRAILPLLVVALSLATASCGSDTTRCADGSISRSTGGGTCSHHGGIARDSGPSALRYVLFASGFGAAFGFWVRTRIKRWRLGLSAGTVSKTAELRKLIQTVVKSDSDLDAFCLDYFKEGVYDAFSGGMERSQKITILLRNADHHEIRRRLHERWPEAVA